MCGSARARTVGRRARVVGVQADLRPELDVRALQRRAIVRVMRDLTPGRYHVTAEIRFQRGAATAPVRLARTVRVCATGAPRFTG
jgi:hypothetical protein